MTSLLNIWKTLSIHWPPVPLLLPRWKLFRQDLNKYYRVTDCLPVLPQRLPRKMTGISKSAFLLVTVAYADIFAYPLTRKELTTWFLFYRTLPTRLPRQTHEFQGFVSVRGRKKIVRLRLQKQKEQKKKWQLGNKAGKILSYIPTIRLIGVTGGLAMNNAAREDDIDLFIVVAGGTLWTTRLIATVLMDLFGLRRKPGDRKIQDKVCLNMFMTE